MYNPKDILRALEILGFQVRAPNGGSSAYCMHGITKEEVWVPTNVEILTDDVLAFLFEHLSLPVAYFQSVYMGLEIRLEDRYPNDQD